MNDENDKKNPTLTEHPLTEDQTAFTEESINVTEPLVKAETTEDQPEATANNEVATPLTEEEEKRIEEEVEVEKIKAAIEEQAREDEQPQSSNFTLRKILGGDILSTRLLRNNIWLIITSTHPTLTKSSYVGIIIDEEWNTQGLFNLLFNWLKGFPVEVVGTDNSPFFTVNHTW